MSAPYIIILSWPSLHQELKLVEFDKVMPKTILTVFLSHVV